MYNFVAKNILLFNFVCFTGKDTENQKDSQIIAE